MAWEWMKESLSDVRDIIETAVYETIERVPAAAMGLNLEEARAANQEWWDKAEGPATRGEIGTPEYHRRGAEILSEKMREGDSWHFKVPYGEHLLPLMGFAYQGLDEGIKGLMGNEVYTQGQTGILGRLKGAGRGIKQGVTNDAVYNLEGMVRAGHFAQDKEPGSTFRQGDQRYDVRKMAPATTTQTKVDPLRSSRKAAGEAQRKAKIEFGVGSTEHKTAIQATQQAAGRLRGRK